MRAIPSSDRTGDTASKQTERVSRPGLSFFRVLTSLGVLAGALALWPHRAGSVQIETIDDVGSRAFWVSMVRLEGHLGLGSSVQSAFSPDGSTLAVTGTGAVVLFDLKKQEIKRVLKPHIENVTDLNVMSANFLDDFNIFIRARGKMVGDGGKRDVRESPELIFQWSIIQLDLFGLSVLFELQDYEMFWLATQSPTLTLGGFDLNVLASIGYCIMTFRRVGK